MPIIKCLICSKEKYRTPRDINRGYGKYCSFKCYSFSRKIPLICPICKKSFLASKKFVTRGSKHCSHKCAYLSPERSKKLSQSLKGKKGWNKGISRPDFLGDKNPSWMGDNISYDGVHTWIHNHYIKSDKCDKCSKNPGFGKDDRNKLHWANKTGKYLRDRTDWLCLCDSCHCKYDFSRKNRKRNNKGQFI